MNIFTWIVTFALIYIPHLLIYVIRRYCLGNKISFKLVPDKMLFIAGAIYPIARFLPEPNISEESVTLMQHFIGGGFTSTIYFYYIEKEFKLKLPLLLRLIFLYATVSSLGAANEILEFSATKIGLYNLDGSDVWWDLVANSLGALTLFVVINIVSAFIQSYKTKKNS